MKSKIKFKVITRSEMVVFFNEKKLLIQGEATITPAFYASILSIKNWEPPHENIVVTEEEKKEIISTIIEKTKDEELKIYFD